MDIITTILTVLVSMAFAAAVAFLIMGAYSGFFERFIAEVREESAGGSAQTAVVVLQKIGVYNRRIMWPGYEEKMRKNLIKAGDVPYKPEDVLAMQEVGFVAGFTIGLLLMNALKFNLLWGLVFAGVGLFYPLIWVNDKIARRHLLISRALPFNLDLLTLSVEAGLDFVGALATVVEKGKTGPLRDELQLVLKQLKMGKTREEALKSMIARVDLPALTQFVTALIQADKMGTSLGKILRIQSTQLRIERTHRAEKLANEAPVKMLLPLTLCIFPTVFMVLFGPIVFAFMYGNVIR